MSNEELIKAAIDTNDLFINDEELAKILSDYSNTCKVCSYWGMCTQYGYAHCYDGIYEWIKQEYEEDGYDK